MSQHAMVEHGCHDCGEERVPRIVAGRFICPECGSENIVNLSKEAIPTTAQDVLDFLRSGGKIRWIPKSIVYNDVRGEDIRFLFVGKDMIREENPLRTLLNSMQSDGRLKGMECRDGVLRIVLPEDYRRRKKNRSKETS